MKATVPATMQTQVDGSAHSVQRRYYLDLLRCLSTIVVVSYHTGHGNIQGINLGIGLYQTLFNWCVPAFCMITGALLLDREETLDYNKCAKYILHTLVVIFVWGFIYNSISLIIINGFSNIGLSLLTAVKMVIKADTSFCYQFWYLYMLVGCYLMLPVLSKFLQNSTRTEQRLIVLIFTVVSICYQTLSRIFGLDDAGQVWFSTFAPFAGYLAYFLIGFWMSRYGLTAKSMATIGITSVVQIVLVAALLINGDECYGHFTGYHSILTCELSIIMFSLCRFLGPKVQRNRFLAPVVSGVSKYSLGIYVLHVMVLAMLSKLFGIDTWGLSPMVSIPVMTLVGTGISMIGVWIVKRIPVLKYLI